jgi:V/A-type H+/Na+-transporting ATPase subunit E
MSQGAPSILQSVAAKSDADAKRIIQIAERVAERDHAAGKKAAEEREAKAMRELDEAAASQKALAAAQSQAEAERRKLAFRQGLVERLLTESLSRLRDMPRDDAYFAIVARLVDEAADSMPVKEAGLQCSARDRDFLAADGRFGRMASEVRSRRGLTLTLSNQPIEAAGGVVLMSPDGKVSYYNTFDEIAYRRRSELKGLIAQELFG